MEPEPVCTIAEAMAMLRCSRGTIRNLRKAGKLHAINIGVGKRRGGPRILLADILSSPSRPMRPPSRRCKRRSKAASERRPPRAL
jgi:hypothetical protein